MFLQSFRDFANCARIIVELNWRERFGMGRKKNKNESTRLQNASFHLDDRTTTTMYINEERSYKACKITVYYIDTDEIPGFFQ